MGNEAKFVAIEFEMGVREIAAALAACGRLFARVSDSQIWLVRVRVALRAPHKRTAPSGVITGVASTDPEAAICYRSILPE